MDLKAVVVIVCLAAVCCFTATQAGIPKCCLQTSKQIPRKLLENVERCELQPKNGLCDIPALVLYVSGRKKPICADPWMKYWLLKRKLRCATNNF
ncbi:hypothetical protein CRUP_032123, partial [Coryphaenoides rupestris]